MNNRYAEPMKPDVEPDQPCWFVDRGGDVLPCTLRRWDGSYALIDCADGTRRVPWSYVAATEAAAKEIAATVARDGSIQRHAHCYHRLGRPAPWTTPGLSASGTRTRPGKAS